MRNTIFFRPIRSDQYNAGPLEKTLMERKTRRRIGDKNKIALKDINMSKIRFRLIIIIFNKNLILRYLKHLISRLEFSDRHLNLRQANN
jgi:hypothetical protein